MKYFLATVLFVFTFLSASLGQNDYKKFMRFSYAELDSFAKIEYETGDNAKALSYMQAGREKARIEFGEQDSLFIEYTGSVIFFHEQIGEYKEAETLYLQMLAIKKKTLGEQHPNYILSLNDLAILYYNTENYAQAELLFLDILSLQKKISGNQHPDYATCLNNLASLYEGMEDYTKAELLFLEALSIRKKTLGDQHIDYATTLTHLATIYYYMGNYTKSEPLYLKALEIQKKALGVEDLTYSTSLNNLAGLYESMGDYDKAEAFYLQVVATRKKTLGERHPDYATSLNNLGILYASIENYAKAEPLYLQALAIRKEVLGEEHPDYASTLNNLAVLYQNIDNYTKAEPLHLQNLAIEKKKFGVLHPSYASSLNNLASLYKKMGSYKEAEPLFLQALEIQKKALGEQHPDYAITLHNLAYLYKSMGNYTKSKSLFWKVLEIEKKVLGERHPSHAKSLNNLGDLYANMGLLDTAFYYCRSSIIANSLGMDKNFSDWSKLDSFNYISTSQINNSIQSLLSIFEKQYNQNKNLSKLESYYITAQSAIRLNQRIRNTFADERDKLRILRQNNDFVLAAIKTGIKLGKTNYESTTFDFAEMNKGMLLLEAAKTANAHQFGDLPDNLIEQQNSLQQQQSNLTAKLIENRPEMEKDSLRRVLNTTNQEIDAFTKMLKKKFPKYAALKYDSKTVTAKEVQNALDEKTALLEYIIGDSAVYVFFINKRQIKLSTIYLANKILNQKIKTLHNTLSDYQLATKESTISYQNFTENAYWFYQNLLAPSLIKLKDSGIEKLIIVTDGELGHLPFEVFLTEPAPQKETNYNELKYLFHKYSISYNYSATIWNENKKLAKQQRSSTTIQQIFAMAGNYETRPLTSINWRLPSDLRQRDALQPLPAAQGEIKILSEKFNGFFAFDKDASEKNFKEKAGDYAIIHLAMHGLLDAKNPILSSLAFTEDGDSLENNFLQVYEISKMKLNADLVVLSACETGYGKFEKGNGIASLAQAFAYAGAPAMIVSLWQVNDFATSEIMKNLYQNLANGMPKDEALQQAKIKYLKEAEGLAAHPAFWSPFILMGNTDAIELKQKGGYFWWLIAVGIVALGLGVFYKLKIKN